MVIASQPLGLQQLSVANRHDYCCGKGRPFHTRDHEGTGIREINIPPPRGRDNRSDSRYI